MTAQALEQSVLESKDKTQLIQIAEALGVKANTRNKKADIIGQILATTGGGSRGCVGSEAFGRRRSPRPIVRRSRPPIRQRPPSAPPNRRRAQGRMGTRRRQRRRCGRRPCRHGRNAGTDRRRLRRREPRVRSGRQVAIASRAPGPPERPSDASGEAKQDQAEAKQYQAEAKQDQGEAKQDQGDRQGGQNRNNQNRNNQNRNNQNRQGDGDGESRNKRRRRRRKGRGGQDGPQGEDRDLLESDDTIEPQSTRAGQGRRLSRPPRRGLRLPAGQQLPGQQERLVHPRQAEPAVRPPQGRPCGRPVAPGRPQREEPGDARDPLGQRSAARGGQEAAPLRGPDGAVPRLAASARGSVRSRRT